MLLMLILSVSKQRKSYATLIAGKGKYLCILLYLLV
jgi:hypothetical protein